MSAECVFLRLIILRLWPNCQKWATRNRHIDQVGSLTKNESLQLRGIGVRDTMETSLRFGRGGLLALDLPEGTLVGDNLGTQFEALEDPAAAVRAALDDPVEFPALNKMLLSDDLVAIAVEPGLPCAAQLLAGTITSIMTAGVPPELIRIVRSYDHRGISDKQLLACVDKAIAPKVEMIRHDPADRESLAFLGATRSGEAIYLNRVLCDAEVVIPIGFYRSPSDGSCLGVHHSWFPAFADLESQNRFTKSLSKASGRDIPKRIAECEEVSWMLGIQMMVQLIPAGDDRALRVLAGTPKALWEKVSHLADDAWRIDLKRRASLVVAAIGGGPDQQTWDNVVRTIDIALDAVEPDGTIAICSQLNSKPGPALRRLAGAEDYEAADRAIRRRPTPDALAASRLNRALQRARVYLLSNLDEADVEDLGVAYVADASEIAKLSSHYDSCLVLQDAQHVAISLFTEADH